MLAWLLLLSLFTQNTVGASPGATTITGRVISDTQAAAVAGATVRIGGASALTGPDGRFTITVPLPAPRPATVAATVSAPGFVDVTVDLATDGQAIDITIRPRPEVRERVVVSAGSGDAAVALPTVELTPREVRSVPGAIDNVFRVLQTMPGVSGTDDFGSRLSVRGGGPDQNLTVMDDVEIHNPYRLFGLTSAFNPETIDRFELTAGGFGPEYGDRLSSIFVVQNRAGSETRRVGGSAALSLTDANVVLEGALPRKLTGSWIVAARRTYYDLFAERVTHDQLPSFNDVQARVVWSPRPGRQISVFALRSREATDAEFDGGGSNRIGVKDDSQNDVASVAFTSPIGGRATSKTVLSWYRYRDGLGVGGTVRDESLRTNSPDVGVDDDVSSSAIGFTRTLGVRDVALREAATIALSASQTLNAGVEFHSLPTRWG
ncbi:MAG: TonB-dependent receptor, partial [Acidobacteriota bacterium]